MGHNQTGGTILLSATSSERNSPDFAAFVYEYMGFLTYKCRIVTTSGTKADVESITEIPAPRLESQVVTKWNGSRITRQDDYDAWKDSIRNGLDSRGPNITGMIRVTDDLIEGRVDAVMHFTNTPDAPDSTALKRVARWRHVPYALNISTAIQFVKYWRHKLLSTPEMALFPTQSPPDDHFGDLESGCDCLAVIAHDKRKADLCEFLVVNKDLVSEYDHILSTKGTGETLKNILGKTVSNKILFALPGREGGDVQIADTVVEGSCKTVIFFSELHVNPQEHADVRLFEPSVLTDVKLIFAPDPVTAELILKSHNVSKAMNASRPERELIEQLVDSFIEVVASINSQGEGNHDLLKKVLTNTKVLVLDEKVVREDELTSEVGAAWKRNAVNYSKKGLKKFLETLEGLPEAGAKTVIQVLVKTFMEP